MRREVIGHSSMVHPHVAKFHRCFLTDRHLAFAMEYAAGGDMHKYVVNKYVAPRHHLQRSILELLLR